MALALDFALLLHACSRCGNETKGLGTRLKLLKFESCDVGQLQRCTMKYAVKIFALAKTFD